jgi:hypothetical protein
MKKARLFNLFVVLVVLAGIAMLLGGLPWGGHAMH